MPPEKTRVKVKTRLRNRMPKDRETFIPITSPTLIFFLIAGAAVALVLVYLILKVLTQMGAVPDMV